MKTLNMNLPDIFVTGILTCDKPTTSKEPRVILWKEGATPKIQEDGDYFQSPDDFVYVSQWDRALFVKMYGEIELGSSQEISLQTW
jgi:hypothetical protein